MPGRSKRIASKAARLCTGDADRAPKRSSVLLSGEVAGVRPGAPAAWLVSEQSLAEVEAASAAGETAACKMKRRGSMELRFPEGADDGDGFVTSTALDSVGGRCRASMQCARGSKKKRSASRVSRSGVKTGTGVRRRAWLGVLSHA